MALNVTEPSSCGVGGDAFALFWDAKTKKVHALNGSGRSPKALDAVKLQEKGMTGRNIPFTDLNSATVPGAAAAWIDSVEKYGSGKVTFADVAAPAIRLAEEGAPVSELSSLQWILSEPLIKIASPDGHAMLLDGKAPLPGQVMRLPDLAETFKTLVREGKDGFYKGRIAEAIVELIKSKGGYMELEDLADHRTEFVEPISYLYGNDVRVYECPPNGQGITALLALGILEAAQEEGLIRPLLEMEHNSTEYLHALVESLREQGDPISSSDTVYFTVTDQWGNAASYIQSNYAGFGTGAIPRDCGFTLQNRGCGFVIDDLSHPNVLKGGKRPYHTIIPSLATRGDELFMSFGVMGGYMQPQGHIQVLLNMLRGLNPQDSLDAPRFCISPANTDTRGPNDTHEDVSIVYVEPGITPETIQDLKGTTIYVNLNSEALKYVIDMGHIVRPVAGVQRALMGRGQIIQRLKTTDGGLVWAAGSDPRADGQAVPQI
ncbi:hypothetical protein FRC17_000036 [Serendipita sp. 399]|nr:hypothetical protein FRC17_000036 [Serendipita sp. 399]